MAKGGRRKGAGRKPTGRAKVAMLIRMAPDVRARLERAAELSEQSLSAAAEELLNYALRSAAQPDQQTRALCFLVASITAFARALEAKKSGHEFDWHGSRFDFEAFKHALIEILDHVAPAGSAESSPYAREATPEQAGHTLASMVVGLLRSPDQLLAYGEAHQKPVGSLYYGFPQAARALGLRGLTDAEIGLTGKDKTK